MESWFLARRRMSDAGLEPWRLGVVRGGMGHGMYVGAKSWRCAAKHVGGCGGGGGAARAVEAVRNKYFRSV